MDRSAAHEGIGDPIRIEPLGDRALLAHFRTESEAAQWSAAVRRLALPGVTDVVLAYKSAAVFTDPDVPEADTLQNRLKRLELSGGENVAGKCLTIPVLYDGPDLEPICQRLGLDVAAAVALHTSVCYEVYAIGFLQGFPYAGYLPEVMSDFLDTIAPG